MKKSSPYLNLELLKNIEEIYSHLTLVALEGRDLKSSKDI